MELKQCAAGCGQWNCQNRFIDDLKSIDSVVDELLNSFSLELLDGVRRLCGRLGSAIGLIIVNSYLENLGSVDLDLHGFQQFKTNLPNTIDKLKLLKRQQNLDEFKTKIDGIINTLNTDKKATKGVFELHQARTRIKILENNYGRK